MPLLALLLDENFDGNIARGVTRRAPKANLVDVRDVGLGGAIDPDVLEWAAREGRVVVTHDVNTMPAHAYERVNAGLPMAGVIIVPDTMPIGPAIEDLLIVLECSVEGEYEGRVFYLPL